MYINCSSFFYHNGPIVFILTSEIILYTLQNVYLITIYLLYNFNYYIILYYKCNNFFNFLVSFKYCSVKITTINLCYYKKKYEDWFVSLKCMYSLFKQYLNIILIH